MIVKRRQVTAVMGTALRRMQGAHRLEKKVKEEVRRRSRKEEEESEEEEGNGWKDNNVNMEDIESEENQVDSSSPGRQMVTPHHGENNEGTEPVGLMNSSRSNWTSSFPTGVAGDE